MTREFPNRRNKLARIIITAVAFGVLGFFITAFVLQPIFSGRIHLPQSVGIGHFRIQFYGLLLGLGALSGYWLAMRRRLHYAIPTEFADNIIFIAIIAGFIGARLYHVISQIGYYSQHPLQIFMVWKGGLGIYGAAIGAVGAIYLYYKFTLRNNKNFSISFPAILDWLTPSIVIGQIIGRFGNFFNYELYGYPTNILWKMFVPPIFRLPPYELYRFFQPLFLYEAAGSTIILILLLKLKWRTGSLFLIWLLLYNVMRFFLEFLRVDSVVYNGIRVNAIVALLLAVFAASLLHKFKPIIKTSTEDAPTETSNS